MSKTTLRALVLNERVLVGLCIASVVVVSLLLAGSEGCGKLLFLGMASMVPISLAAMGELVNERAGLFNIGIEGIMVIAGFVSAYGAQASQSGYVGLLAGVMSGAALAFLFGVLATYGKADQLIMGIGLNLAAAGIVGFYLWVVWGSPGFHLIPSYLRMPKLPTPMGSMSYLVPVALAIPFLTRWALEHTAFGLRAKGAGYDPFVTDVCGVNVYRLRTTACTFGGALAGLAGAYMALDWVGLTLPGLAQGRGFIAIACLIFGGLDPVLTLEAAFLFGLISATGLWLQNVPLAAPLMRKGGSYLFAAVPYVTVLIVLFVFPRKERISKMIGIPYRREQ